MSGKDRILEKMKKGHNFALSPCKEAAFNKCPNCEGRTRIRKFPLVIHLEPKQLFVLNKVCRYCEACDLIIARQHEVEAMLNATLQQRAPHLVGSKYFIFGTLKKSDWRDSHSGKINPAETLDRAAFFKAVWDVKIDPGGWFPADYPRPPKKKLRP